ncbi:MAG: response regulator transcription factor [Thermanaerothrix sp.]|nr:response regulator transcription factor [Thermanaerothrix sp.]
MATTILVVDDQASVRQLLQEYLTEHGFRVITASDGQSALYTARHENPDVILLDLMMPRMDGYQFIKQFRQERQTPIIIVTAREEESDAVLGLELGADDYVVKPFRLRELVARIRATLRRVSETPERVETLHVGDLWVDLQAHVVKVRGREVYLTPLEFDLLVTFMRAPGRVFTRDELANRLADSGFAGVSSTLNVHIRNLRCKIEKEPGRPEWIETVFGVGYRLRKVE